MMLLQCLGGGPTKGRGLQGGETGRGEGTTCAPGFTLEAPRHVHLGLSRCYVWYARLTPSMCVQGESTEGSQRAWSRKRCPEMVCAPDHQHLGNIPSSRRSDTPFAFPTAF